MEAYTFNLDAFPHLTMKELLSGRSLIGKDILSESEFQQFEALIAYLPVTEALNTQEVLLVQADANGVLERVYAPSLFATEEGGIILRVGSNTWPVTQQPGKFSVGSLTGYLNVEMRENLKEEQYMLVSINFSDDADTASFVVGVRLSQESELTQVQLQKLVARGGSIVPHLMVAGTAGTGGDVGKMHELGCGEYALTDIEQVEIAGKPAKDGKPEEQPRTSWILSLETGDRVWAKGTVIRLLKDDSSSSWIKTCVRLAKATVEDTKTGFKLSLATPHTLKISNIVEMARGFSVTCQIVERAPLGIPALPSVGVAAIAPVMPQRQLVGNAPAGSLEDIPF